VRKHRQAEQSTSVRHQRRDGVILWRVVANRQSLQLNYFNNLNGLERARVMLKQWGFKFGGPSS
jgi:hypothetical protein